MVARPVAVRPSRRQPRDEKRLLATIAGADSTRRPRGHGGGPAWPARSVCAHSSAALFCGHLCSKPHDRQKIYQFGQRRGAIDPSASLLQLRVKDLGIRNTILVQDHLGGQQVMLQNPFVAGKGGTLIKGKNAAIRRYSESTADPRRVDALRRRFQLAEVRHPPAKRPGAWASA